MTEAVGKNGVPFRVPVGCNFDKGMFEDADEGIVFNKSLNQIESLNDADKNKR